MGLFNSRVEKPGRSHRTHNPELAGSNPASAIDSKMTELPNIKPDSRGRVFKRICRFCKRELNGQKMICSYCGRNQTEEF